MKIETRGEQHAFEIGIHLDGLDPNAVRVELYADSINGASPVRQEMKRIVQPATASAGTEYHAARIIPYCEGVTIPLEEARILWQT